jgi:hypothetical protein
MGKGMTMATHIPEMRGGRSGSDSDVAASDSPRVPPEPNLIMLPMEHGWVDKLKASDEDLDDLLFGHRRPRG